MAVRDFQSCDFLLNNGADLRISPPFDCAAGRTGAATFTVESDLVQSGVSTSITFEDVAGSVAASTLVSGPVVLPAGTTITFTGGDVVTTDIQQTLDETTTSLSIVSTTIAAIADGEIGTVSFTNQLNDTILDRPKAVVLKVEDESTVSSSPTILALDDNPNQAGVLIPIGTELVLTQVGSATVGSTTATTLTVVAAETKTLTGTADTLTIEENSILDQGASAVPTATSYVGISFSQLLPVLSINQADSTINQNELEDRNFRSSDWVTRRVTNRSGSVTCSGVYVRKDAGLYLARLAAFQIDRVYFELQEGDEASSGTAAAGGDVGLEGWATLVDFQETRANDQHKQVSFGLNIDGEPSDYVIT